MLEKNKILNFLKNVIRIYSPTGQETRLAMYLLSVLKDWGYDAWIDDVGNVIAIKSSGEPTVWLHAHMDTVPGEIPVSVEGDYVSGRGAVDDKGPLVSYMLAFHLADVKSRTVLTLVVDEEGDSRGTLHLLNSGEVPKPRFVFVGEPTNMHIAYAYRGGAKIVISRSSMGGHSSSSPIYNNPIDEVLSIYLMLLNKLSAGNRYEDFTVTPTFMSCGDAYNKIPNMCKMVVDVRIPPNKSCSDVKRVVDELRIEMINCIEPVVVNPTNLVARALIRAVIRRGIKPILSRKWGTSDMNILAHVTSDIAAFGPGDPTLAHTDREVINVDDVLKASLIIKDAIEELPKLAHKAIQ